MFSLFGRRDKDSAATRMAHGSPALSPPTLPLPDLSPTTIGLGGLADAGDRYGAWGANASTASPRPANLFKAITSGVETYLLRKGVEQNYWRSVARSQSAALQGTVVNPALDYWGGYDGDREKTGTTFEACRRMAQDNEAVACIIGKRVNQVTSYSRRSVVRRGKSSEPGFHIKLSDLEARATPDDKKRIAELEQFFEECGYVDPPTAERPLAWQPGFDSFLSMLTRDALTLDHVAVRRWHAAEDPKKYPILAFACVDAAQIQFAGREMATVKDGVPVWKEAHDRERTNTKDRIAYKKVSSGGQTLEEFTERELFTGHRRHRSDESVNGYGFSEIEEAWIAATLWCSARDFNGLRFSKNTLPRGLWVLFGNFTSQAFSAFQLAMKQQMQGVKNSMNIPVVSGSPQAGSSVQFVPVDPTPKDLEHAQSLFSFGCWIHNLYQISPDETGFSATSPFRPPLSEASPETNLKYSQDTGLRPLLRWIENLVNRELLWVLDQSRRFKFEFVGVGDYDEQADIAVRSGRLQAGLSTPEMEWNELDITMPPEIASHPAARFPAPFAVGLQMLQSMGNQEQQAQQGAGQPGQGPEDGGQAAPKSSEISDDSGQDSEAASEDSEAAPEGPPNSMGPPPPRTQGDANAMPPQLRKSLLTGWPF